MHYYWKKIPRQIGRFLLDLYTIVFLLSACTYDMGSRYIEKPEFQTTKTPPQQNIFTDAPATPSLPPPYIENSIPTEERESPPQRTQYDLTAVLDYSQHYLVVSEIITYTNRSAEGLADLILMVDANRYNGVFQLNEPLLVNGKPVEVDWLESNQLKIPLHFSLQTGERVVLSLAYDLFLPSPMPNPYTRPVPFGYTSRQTNLVDWYPFVAPFIEGKGWLAHKAGYFGEHLVYDNSDFQVNLHIPDYEPMDIMQSSSLSVSDTSRRLIMAASSLPIIDGEWYRYRLENARNFVWSVSPEYVVHIKKIDDVLVVGYSFPLHGAAGEAALEVTGLSLSLYNDLFGLYPHDILSVVEADFLDGMEYDGLYFLSNGFYNLFGGSPSEYLTAIAAHETAHQWWYGVVGNDQAMDPWLDESMCTYSERLFYENLYPEALDWWWTYRINYYQPHGYINGSIYSYTENTDAYRAYRDAVYLNGALFFEELRQLVGDEVFFAFLKAYVDQNQTQISTPESFFNVLHQHALIDLAPVILKYFADVSTE